MTYFYLFFILCITTALELFKTKQKSIGLFVKCLGKLIFSLIPFSPVMTRDLV